MFTQILKNLTGKDIAMVITAAGGIVLAGFLVFYNQNNTEATLSLAGNHINANTKALVELSVAIKSVAEGQKENKEVIRETKDVIQANTNVIRGIFNRQ